MEAQTAKLMWIWAAGSGLHYDVQVGDEDATTRKKLVDEVPEHLRPSTKKSDHNHIKRNLKDHLFKLKKKKYSGKGVLSTAIILKLTSDFSVAIKTNQGDASKCQAAIENIVNHNFGDHTQCGNWCKYSDNSKLKPHLPHGNFIYESLQL